MGSYFSSLGKDHLIGRSKCGKCTKTLRPIELIPIFSYLKLKGRCSICMNKINPLYIILEIVGAIVYPIIYLFTKHIMITILFGSIILLLLRISIIDLQEGYIYIIDILWILLLRVILFLIHMNNPIPYILSGLSIAALLLFIQIISKGLGTGDIFYGMVLSSFFPLSLATYYFISWSFILGGLIAAFKLYILHKNRRDKMAFAPFLSIGFLITIIWRSLC
ncbi:MAG: prepilin peptidase [Tissierellia bacterium]|nr:prepilin peptidase [Tissierellia bacterium]